MESKRLIYLLCSLLVLSSCSTQKRARFYGGVTGGFLGATIGGMIGNQTSPEGRTNQIANTALGAALGVTLGGLGGWWLGGKFYGQDPENIELEKMDVSNLDIPVVKPSESFVPPISAKISATKVYNVPVSDDIPAYIKAQMKQPIIIEHLSSPQYVPVGDRLFYIPEFKVIEQTYSEQQKHEN